MNVTTATYGTVNGEQLVRNQQHTLASSEGGTFTGTSRGVSVKQGVLFAVFENVVVLDEDGEERMTLRWFSLPLSALTTPRPTVLGI